MPGRQADGLSISLPESYTDQIELSEGVKILDVPYLHLKTRIGDDLYLTDAGLPYLDDLLPDNFARDRNWFNSVKVPLPGSSTPFRIPLKQSEKEHRAVLFKWNRMGTDPMIPDQDAIFNSPFEEFALAAEVESRIEGRFRLQIPLAIYVPSERHSLETLQRRRHLLDFLTKRSSEDGIDVNRDYAVIYAWAEGEDLWEQVKGGELELDAGQELSEQIAELLDQQGYAVDDHKLNHLVAEPKGDKLELKDIYLIDFELLRRTAKHERTIKNFRRQRYYQLRLKSSPSKASELRREILGVPFIETFVESSGGRLWVRGEEEEFIDYFFPEKWQTTARIKLNRAGNTYLTESKDGIKLVVKSSKVGMKPIPDTISAKEAEANIPYHYNSPFEEAQKAESLQAADFPTARLLAIYRMNQEADIADYLRDDHPYQSHRGLLDSAGEDLLQQKRQYLTIWDYWQGEDEDILINTVPPFSPVSLLEAHFREMLDSGGYETMLRYVRFKLSSKGFIDYSLKASHLILAADHNGGLIRDETGMPSYRLCSFSLLDSAQNSVS